MRPALLYWYESLLPSQGSPYRLLPTDSGMDNLGLFLSAWYNARNVDVVRRGTSHIASAALIYHAVISPTPEGKLVL